MVKSHTNFDRNKQLPKIPTAAEKEQARISKQLQMIDESFEDVTLDVELEKYQNKMLKRQPSKRTPMKRVYPTHSSYSVDQFNVSADALLSSSPSKAPAQLLHQHQKHQHQHQNQYQYQSPSQSQSQSQVVQQLTPSQRLRIRRKQLNDDLENSIRHENMSTPKNKDIDSLSDDELPDNFIVYNVPLSKSLKALSTKEQYIMNQPFSQNYVPRSYYEMATRASSLTDSNRSSVFSYNSALSNATDENLSSDAKFFTIELNKSISMVQNEESQQRIFHLKKMMSATNNSRDSVYSNTSQSSLVSANTSKYFSATRPTNLPPKDVFESLKHLKDYESILSHAMKQEFEKCNNQAEFMKITARQKDKDYQQWLQISKNLIKNLSKTSTRELWWRGIPSQLRSEIWCEQIGNKLQITDDEVLAAFAKVEANQEIMDKINLHCYPNLSIFNNNDSLFKLVSAYISMCGSGANDVGLYSLSATLLYNIRNPVKAFIALRNILHRKLSYAFMNNLTGDEYLQSQIKSFDKIFNRKLNRLSTHFKIYGIDSLEFLKPLCSYCMSNYLELSKSSLLIDIYLFEGDSFLLRCVLGFLQRIDYKLFGSKDEVLALLGENCLVNLNQHLFDDGKDQVKKSDELIYGFKYLDLGLDEEFFQGVRNVLRD